MSRPSTSLALVLACAVCACAHQAPPPPVAPPPPAPDPAPAPAPAPAPPSDGQDAQRLQDLRDSVDHYLQVQATQLWESWSRGAAPDFASTAEAHAALFAPATLAFVRQQRDRASGDERRALGLLHAFLAGEHLARALPAPAAPTAFAWEGQVVPCWRAPGLLAAEGDAARRAALERAWTLGERQGADAVAAQQAALAAAAKALGYDSTLALAEELRGERADALAELAQRVLAATDGPYTSLVDALAQVELGVPLAQVRGRDLPRLFRSGEDPRAFPAARAAQDATGALAAVDLDPRAQPGVALDLAPRPGKDPRALAVPVRVPGDVRLSAVPQAGAVALRGLLHELGAVAYYAHVTAPGLEARRLGAVTVETWAGLFEDLADDPGWLEDHTVLPETHVAALVRSAAARRLHLVRVMAARVLVEVARARDPAGFPAAARKLLPRVMARPVEADELERFLLERDPLLEAADGLRAELLAAQARAHLVAAAGATPWWKSAATGAALRASFAEGSRLSPADLARSLGAADGLAPDALAAWAAERARAAGVRPAPRRTD